jgi:hypothetical protein
MQSVPITTYFVSSNTAHGILDIILGDIVCQLLVTTGRWFIYGFVIYPDDFYEWGVFSKQEPHPVPNYTST